MEGIGVRARKAASLITRYVFAEAAARFFRDSARFPRRLVTAQSGASRPVMDHDNDPRVPRVGGRVAVHEREEYWFAHTGCPLEIIMKSTTIPRNGPEGLARRVEIVREEIEACWTQARQRRCSAPQPDCIGTAMAARVR